MWSINHVPIFMCREERSVVNVLLAEECYWNYTWRPHNAPSINNFPWFQCSVWEQHGSSGHHTFSIWLPQLLMSTPVRVENWPVRVPARNARPWNISFAESVCYIVDFFKNLPGVPQSKASSDPTSGICSLDHVFLLNLFAGVFFAI